MYQLNPSSVNPDKKELKQKLMFIFSGYAISYLTKNMNCNQTVDDFISGTKNDFTIIC